MGSKTVVRLAKADSFGVKPTEETVIEIADSIPKNIKNANLWYTTQAKILTDALCNSLPQATLDRLLIALMKIKVSFYRGKMGS